MQAGLTRLPEVAVAPRFKPFVEDELDSVFPDSLRLLAHPGPRSGLPGGDGRPRRPLLAVGPEGGWTAYETERLLERGFTLFSLGDRILRCDTACVALLAVLEDRL
jgi:RsmE family RNA methyltransferase